MEIRLQIVTEHWDAAVGLAFTRRWLRSPCGLCGRGQPVSHAATTPWLARADHYGTTAAQRHRGGSWQSRASSCPGDEPSSNAPVRSDDAWNDGGKRGSPRIRKIHTHP